MRKLWLGVIGLAAASTANAAVVTYTLSLHESATGTIVTTNNFVVYATVSQGDNAGLFAYGVDLKGTGDSGGPTTLSLVNRTPNGTWSVDPADPNYDPGNAYPQKFGGYGAGRSSVAATGIVSGVTDLSKAGDLVPVFGIGQTARKMDDSRPAPDTTGNPDGSPVAYAAYVASPNTDGGATAYGNPFNPASAPLIIPAGSIRIATGSWTGTLDKTTFIEQASVNTKASVWKLSHPNNTENDIATLQFAFRDLNAPTGPSATLNPTASNANQAVGGSIAVTGSNGSYSSEVDQLLDPSVNKGSAPIQTIGDEAGSVYVMAKLVGSAADIATLLGNLTTDVDQSDSQFALLHSGYDSQFGNGGFNALFKFANPTGAKVFNWDFSALTPNVTIDQLAAVPEPGTISLLGLGALGLLARRRRNA